MSTDHPSPSGKADPAVEEFRELIRLASAGEADACRRLYDDYWKHVRRIVRRRLDRRLRTIMDSIDVTQDVWASIFRDALTGQAFSSPAQFMRFLEAVAVNKTLEHYRRQIGTQKRSLSREEPMNEHEGEVLDRAGGGESCAEQAGDEDEWARLLAGPPERARGMVEAFRAGGCLEELAWRFDLSAKQLRRVVGRAATGWGLAPRGGVLTPCNRSLRPVKVSRRRLFALRPAVGLRLSRRPAMS